MNMRVKKLVFYNHLAFNVNPLVAVLISLHIHEPLNLQSYKAHWRLYFDSQSESWLRATETYSYQLPITG